MTVIADLSHPYYAGMPHATTIPAPRFEQVRSIEEHGLRVMELVLPTHLGTHIDAPSHFVADGGTIDEVPPEKLIGPALCVEVAKPADTPIEVADLAEACADARPGDALLVRTRWDDLFAAPDYLHHPYLSAEAARWVADQGFRIFGIDTVTPELPGPLRPAGYPCPVHTTLLGSGVLIVENLMLREVVGRRFTLVVGALRIHGGDGSPARALAILDT